MTAADRQTEIRWRCDSRRTWLTSQPFCATQLRWGIRCSAAVIISSSISLQYSGWVISMPVHTVCVLFLQRNKNNSRANSGNEHALIELVYFSDWTEHWKSQTSAWSAPNFTSRRGENIFFKVLSSTFLSNHTLYATLACKISQSCTHDNVYFLTDTGTFHFDHWIQNLVTLHQHVVLVMTTWCMLD